MATIKEMQEKLEITQKLLKAEEKLADLNEKQREAIQSTAGLLKQNREQTQLAVDDAQRRLDIVQKQFDKNQLTAEQAVNRQAAIKKELEGHKQVLKLLNSKILKGKLDADQRQRVLDINRQITAEKAKQLRAANVEKRGLQEVTTVQKQNATAAGLVADAVERTLEVGKVFASQGAGLLDALPEVVLAKYLGFQLSLRDIGKEVQSLPVQFDKAFSGIVKATGMPLESIKNNLQAAVDPEGARAGIEGFQESLDGLNLGVDDQPFVDIGITVEDSKEALSALIQESSLFRADFLKNEPAAASVTANLVAGLKKVGVQTKTSAKLIDVFTKAFGKTPVEAGKSLRSVAGIAKSLGMDINKVFGNFESSMPTLSQFGSEMTEVFADLQARSAATGAEMGKLVGIAMKMDTFEGAAKAAQTLNGVLGDTLISVTDLAHADPDEKFDMIAEAVNNSGVEFESLNRRYKSIIASAAGFDNVAEFQRQLLGEEAVDEAKAAVDTGPLTTENLAERAKQGMDMQDKSKASVSSFGVAAVKAYEAASGAADEYNKVVKNSLVGTVKAMHGDLGKAFIAAREGLEMLGMTEAGVDAVVGKAATAARGVGATVLGAGAVLENITREAPADTGPQADAAGAAGGDITDVRVAALDPDAGTAMVEFVRRQAGEVITEQKEAGLAAMDGSQYA
jgi:hypothetical protein